MAIRNLDWYDLNEERSWPIEETATMMSDAGDRLPSNIIADVQFRFPATVGEFAYVSAVTVGPGIVSVVIVSDHINPAPLAVISLPRPVEKYRIYPLEALYPGVGGWIVFGDGIEATSLKTYRFSTAAQSRLMPHAARRYRSMPVGSMGKLNVANALSGVVKVVGGDDVEIVKEIRDIDGKLVEAAVIRLAQKTTGDSGTTQQNLFDKYRGPCGQRPENHNCTGPEPIEFINNVGPDCCGTITFEFRGCSELSFVGNENCSIFVDCGFGLAEACVSPDKLPDASGVLPDEFTDLCDESVSVIGDGDVGGSGPITSRWFTLIALSDTADQTANYSTVLSQTVDWMLINRDIYNIKFVTDLADVITNGGGSGPAWSAAVEHLHRIDNLTSVGPYGEGRIPVGFLPGNRDYDIPGNRTNATNYATYLAGTLFARRGYQIDASPNGRSTAQKISFNGWTYLHLSLELEVSGADLTWAVGILTSNPDCPTILSTHKYINADGSFASSAFGGSSGTTLYNTLVKPFANVFLVLCGSAVGEYHRQDTNDAGKLVHTFLQAYNANEQWNAWIRRFEIDSTRGEIRISTYSTIHDINRPASENIVVAVDWATRFGDANGDLALENSIGAGETDASLPYTETFEDTVANDFSVKIGAWAVVADTYSGQSYEAASAGATPVGYGNSWNIAVYEGAITAEPDWNSTFRTVTADVSMDSDVGAASLHNAGIVLGYKSFGGIATYISVDIDWSGTYTGQKCIRVASYNGNNYQTVGFVAVPALALDKRYTLTANISALDDKRVYVTGRVQSVGDATVDVTVGPLLVESTTRDGLMGLITYKSKTQFLSFTIANQP